MGCISSSPFFSDTFHGDYKLGERLGEGNFGQVRVAKVRSSNEVRAVKIVDVRCSTSAGSSGVDRDKLQAARLEAELMKRVAGHKHCVELFATFEAPFSAVCYMVMEKCRVSLMERLEEMQSVGEAYLSRLFHDILLGIAHVHSLNIVHRDVKPCNILFGGPDGETVKLMDFGMAEELPPSGFFTNLCGTPPYMSPEVVGGKQYDFRTDVWSMGVTAYLVLCDSYPFRPRVACPKAMKKMILLGEPAPDFTPASKNARGSSQHERHFVETLMTRDPKHRCTAQAALQLPFVRPSTPREPDEDSSAWLDGEQQSQSSEDCPLKGLRHSDTASTCASVGSISSNTCSGPETPPRMESPRDLLLQDQETVHLAEASH